MLFHERHAYMSCWILLARDCNRIPLLSLCNVFGFNQCKCYLSGGACCCVVFIGVVDVFR
uniref:Secreted protein n=1 Tax=Ascaris lumbricoides TaxID=6252 RepID=A0A0M3IJC5_ASCLU